MAAPVYTNLGAANPTVGTTCTAGSANNKGAYVQLSAATPTVSSRLYWFQTSGSTSDQYLADLATGAAGSEVVVIANQYFNLTSEIILTDGGSPVYELDIAASTRIAERCQSTSSTVTVSTWILLEDRALGTLGATSTYGAVTASSRGTSIDPGSGGTKSGYTELSAASTATHKAWMFNVALATTGHNISSYVKWGMDFATGAGGAEVIQIADISFNATTVIDVVQPRRLRYVLSVASGTRLAVRALAQDSSGAGVATANDRTFGVLVTGTDSLETVPTSLVRLGTAPTLSITGAGTANTESAYVEVEDATTVAGPRLHIGEISGSGGGRYLVDWSIGAAGLEVVKVSDAQMFFDDDATQGWQGPIDFDIALGSRLAARHRCSQANFNLRISTSLEARALNNASTTTYGVVATGSNTTNTSIDCGAVANTDSAWIEFTPACAVAHEALTLLPAYPAALGLAANTAFWMDLATGAAGAEVEILSDHLLRAGFGGDNLCPTCVRIRVEIAAGTRISARAMCSSVVASDRTMGLSFIAQGGTTSVEPIQKTTQMVLLVGYDEDAALEENLPPEVTACTGSGTIPSGTNPTPGTSLADKHELYAWIAFTLGGTDYQFASNAINKTATPKEPRVESFGVCARGLTDAHGQIEFPSMTIQLIDHDRILRGLMTLTWINTPVTVYVADITTLSAPRVYFHGVMRQFRQPPGLRAEMVLESRLTLFTANGAEEKTIPARVLDSQVTDANPTEKVNGLPAPLLFGSLSDEADSNPIGVVPGRYIASETPAFIDDNLHKFLVCQMAVKNIQAVYLADILSGEEATSRMKAPANYYDDVIYVPHQSDEMGRYTDQADLRWTYVYGKDGHPAIELARSGRIPLLFNVCGHETVGDGTGTMWSNPGRIALVVLNNKFAQEAETVWLSILSLGGYTLFDITAFEAVATICTARGYAWAGIIGADGEAQNFRDTLADLCRNGDFDLGENRYGQWSAWMLDRTSAYSSATTFVDGLHIVKDSFEELDSGDDGLENEIQYVYKRNYAEALHAIVRPEGSRPEREPFDGKWFSDGSDKVLTDPDETVITAMGGRPRGLRQSEVQEYNLVRVGATATDLARQRRERKKVARSTVAFTVPMNEGDGVELGDVVKLTHFAGKSATGWTGRRLQVRRIEDDLDQFTRRFTCLDVDNLLA